MVSVSLLTPKPNDEQIVGLTFATTVNEDKASSRASWGYKEVILSLIVLVIIASIFLYFSPIGIGAAK
jgi:SSS family solute:Na+ symporter